MKLLAIRMYRFGSFSTEVEFVFPTAPGLYFLRGVNEREPALEANGAGKSTLWNAICWVLFDQNVKGLRAGDVANWDSPKGARVELDYTDDINVYRVTRQHAPNKWRWQVLVAGTMVDADSEDGVDLAKDADNPVLSTLRLELLPFLNCVLMGQGKPMFLDLTATAKASLFSDVLSLDVWDARSKRASQRAAVIDGDLRDLDRQLANVDGKLAGINHRKLDGNAEDWERDRGARVRDIMERHTRAIQTRRLLLPGLADLKDRCEAARKQLKHKADMLHYGRRELEDATRSAARAKATADAGERHLNELSDERERRRHMQECPTCNQRVDADKLVAAMQAVMTPLARKQADLWADDHVAEQERAACAGDIKVLEVDVDDARTALNRAERDVQDAERNVAMIDRDLDRLEDDAEDVQKERNPYAGMRDEALRDERALRAQRVDLVDAIDATASEHYRTNYWVRGFKEVRLRRIRESLAEYEIEANSNVAELGLVDWSLRFDVDRETKGGTVKSGFDVRVLSPHNDRPVPWEAWSGGEGQRLRLAGQAGLADLIRSRTATPLNLEVWDEPTEHMSGGGVTDLLNALADRARRCRRQIWVVDHRSLGYGGFTDVFTVVKDDNGSKFTHG